MVGDMRARRMWCGGAGVPRGRGPVAAGGGHEVPVRLPRPLRRGWRHLRGVRLSVRPSVSLAAGSYDSGGPVHGQETQKEGELEASFG